MLAKIRKPTADFNHNIPAVISRFTFDRPARVVGRSTTDDSMLGSILDPDIHNGTIVHSNGYARLARHKPTGAICLITSKSSVNLQGEMQEDGTICATHHGLASSYISAAYRSNGSNDDIHRLVPKLRRDSARFFEDLGERSEKHFTLYGAAVEKEEGYKNKADSDHVEIYTNGRLSYAMERKGKKYIVRFHAPTQRKGGSFIPVHNQQKGLSRLFASVSKEITRADSYEQAYDDMMRHWQLLSSKLWDEKNIFSGEGRLFRTKKLAADVANHILDNGPRIAAVTVAVGVITGLVFMNKYGGILGGVAAAAIHAALDIILDEGYMASSETVKQAKEARKKLDIDAYDYSENCADHFKIQTPDNINRLCAKMDLQRFKAEDFEFLNAQQSQMLQDHDQVMDGFRPSSLRAHLLCAHQRGFSSSCFLPDPYTRVDAMQSGLTRLLHEKQDGTIVLFSRYRPDICVDERLRLPEDKRERMGDKIWRFEYERERDNFHHAFKRTAKDLTVDDMMAEVQQDILFRDQPDIDQAAKSRSCEAIRKLFSRPEEQQNAAKNKLYMSGQPIHPPFITSFARFQAP